MGWIKKEAKSFGKEFVRQGCIFVFGKAPHSKHHHPRKKTGAQMEYERVQRWARKHGFK